jgi:hypothetical protein
MDTAKGIKLWTASWAYRAGRFAAPARRGHCDMTRKKEAAVVAGTDTVCV